MALKQPPTDLQDRPLCAIRMRAGKNLYRHLARFWTKIFAVSLSLGIVSGIVLSYQHQLAPVLSASQMFLNAANA